jgi:hypothetical protein
MKINLYVGEADEKVIHQLRLKLERENKSMSEFVIDAAKDYLEAQAKPGEIVLQGLGQKRIFAGNQLYWNVDRDHEMGVFLTAKGAIAFWSLLPRAINPDEREKFEVFDTLEEFLEEKEWIHERRNRGMKEQIEQEYSALTNRQRVERLDI